MTVQIPQSLETPKESFAKLMKELKSLHADLKRWTENCPGPPSKALGPPSVSGAFSSLIRRKLALRVDFALAFDYKTCQLTGRLLDFVLNLSNFRLY